MFRDKEVDPACCYSFMWLPEFDHTTSLRAADCSGILGSAYELDDQGGAGYYIQVCPRLAWLGRAASGINFCGDSPDVLVLHRNTYPSRAEFKQAVIDNADIF